MFPTDYPSQQNPPPQNLSFLYQRHRSRLQEFQQLSQKNNSSGNYDVDKREAYGEKLSRMYGNMPRDFRQTGPALQRYSSSASPQPVTSPLLSALGTTVNYTSDWTKSLPYFTSAQSPQNVESPTNAIPIQTPRNVISASPPSVKYHSQPNHNGLPSLSPREHTLRGRRASLYSQAENFNAYRSNVPLPHEDQAHFHVGGLPNFDSIGAPQEAFHGLMPGEKGYFCGWDTLGNAGHAPSSSAENVIITGYEGGVNVYKISKKDKPVIVGCLQGLKGAVLDAKILPWAFGDDPGIDGRPYIALVIHGPVIGETAEPQNSSDESAAVSTEDDSSAPSERSKSRCATQLPSDEAITAYRTTVEIYSLANSRYIETIYATPSISFKMPTSAFDHFVVPEPIGDLKLDANGKCLVVASGESGETFIYTPMGRAGSRDLGSIRCIGKLWTTVERRNSRRTSSQAPSRPEAVQDDSDLQRSIPLFSLSHRFLAIVPPSHTIHSVNGTAHLGTAARKPPGIHNHVAPASAAATCDTDDEEGSDFMNRVSREVTQRAIVAGSVIKDRGMKVWETYWNSGTNQPGNRASYPQGGPVPVSHLPPTHGYNGPLNESHDAQVAIFDLERFIDAEEAHNKHGKSKNALSPIASFDLASGCSYLSFAPAGLHLLTISRKGDVQNVWSLMRIKDQRAGLTFGINTRPVVRNIFKATRMTITKVIDVVWFEPHGHRFALLSENGTVHIHDIPASRFKWPPSRLTSKTKPTQRSQSEEAQSRKSGYSGMAFSAVTGASQWAQSVRQRSLSGQIGFGSLALTPANFSKKAGRNLIKHGTNVIVRGATDIYHVKDNKLSLQSTLDVLKSRSIRLLTGRGLHGYLGVVAAGTVYLYQIKTVISSRSSNGPTKYHAKISKKAMNFSLGSIPSDQFAPAVVSIIEKRNGIPSSLSDDTTVHGHWLLRAPQPSLQRAAQRVQREDWRNMVEFTTNPAHIAFHQDGRVSLFAFPEPTQSPPRLPDRSSTEEDFEQYDADRRVYDDEVLKPHIRATHHINDESVWLFGEALLNLRLIKEGSGGYTLGEDEDGDLEYNMVKLDDGTGTLVLNTVPRSSRADEEFFEDGAELVDYSEGIGRA